MGNNEELNSLSIVIPVYNAEEFIEEQITAIYSNDLPKNFEIIIADNGCTDKTIEVVSNLSTQYKEIKVIDASAKKGSSFARNKGVDSAIYDYIILCDADDVVFPDFISQLAHKLEDNDLVGAGYITLDWDSGSGQYVPGAVVTKAPESIGGLKYALSGVAAMRKSLFTQLDGFDESYIGGHEEVDFCYRALLNGFRFCWIDQPLIYYRQRSNSKNQIAQYYLYGKTWMQLGYRFRKELDLEMPGYKTLTRRYIESLINLKLFKRSENDLNPSRTYGWHKGRLAGVVLFRFFKKLPHRVPWSNDKNID